MVKVVMVDVGTHRAQEFSAIFEHSSIAYLYKYLRRCVGFYLLRRGVSPSLTNIMSIIKQGKSLKDKRSDFYCVFVEPNRRLFSLPMYSKADMAVGISLSKDNKIASLKKLFHANHDNMSQGSSLYQTKANVDESFSDAVLNMDPRAFAKELKEKIEENSSEYKLILRINNEGAEGDVIYGFEETFNSKLVAVMGSLKDTQEIRGDAAMDALNQFMKDKEIAFIPLSSSMDSWPKAFRYLRSLVS